MDIQKFADTFFSPACIVSVQKKADGGYGDIRLAAGNKKYIEMIDMRINNKEFYVSEDAGDTFVPNSLYSKYFPKSRSFEDVCYKAAIQKIPVHTYGHVDNVDIWFDIYAVPLELEDEDVCYCAYTVTPSKNADIIFNTANTVQTSNDVLKTCIKLHKANNLKDAMENVISEIRAICKAECCTVLLLNDAEATYSILATDFKTNSKLKRVTEFEGFYDIATSWISMIGNENDCIIIQDKADMDYYSRINNPWYLTLVEAGVESVVLFPLRQGLEILGFIWATNFDTDDTMRIKETLELTTFFVSSHIARYKVIKHLKHMSYTDALTELPNRFACTDHIADLISRRKKFTAVSIDLNHFKSINDSLGLEAGNQVLIEISERWKALSGDETTAVQNFITRINGDEFMLVICDYNSDEELKDIIEKYADALSEPLTVDGCDLYITASFGYAEYPTDAQTADSLISHADAAMNEIKKANSSDHILGFTSDILRNEHILEVENKIRAALENNTIYFNLQPQYDMDHKLRGFEALARMKDTDGTPISPGEFIPIAEKVGLIDKVDSMVFQKATLFFSSLIKKTGLDLTLSINASVRHIMKNGFVEEICDLIKNSGLSTDQLEIEITESILIDSAEKALQCINELKSIGVKFAIDDFGTGYSSLSYLNKIPVNLLKIDKSFIDRINSNESSNQYVKAMISMGHIMGLDVISEGVEKSEQVEVLRSIGCDFIQGFIWGRPMSAEDAEKLVSDIANNTDFSH
ncbi:sensor domain-containing phosphodiesterase [Ruminococcus flavefaciens]|uniref:Diguanylate cyclase (GGDEF) domain-containing protein n=1 Tax=Ruminococcus flavefaciens TaxID=1265 RepID=A0A1M7HP76_RUMFL|nr:bifunctional diguanylate cyclase/phosphodiesterase [Ruminococcus flavefaciens]SHM30295.1 diguanylate cyclase (GGDEF) domain-containing protein [Ruminococcus flavefaciens]